MMAPPLNRRNVAGSKACIPVTQEAGDLISSANQAVEALDHVHPEPAPATNDTITTRSGKMQ